MRFAPASISLAVGSGVVVTRNEPVMASASAKPVAASAAGKWEQKVPVRVVAPRWAPSAAFWSPIGASAALIARVTLTRDRRVRKRPSAR